MPGATISIIDNPGDEDYQAILNPLLAFNNAQTEDERFEQIALMLRDELGNAVGGLWGRFYYDWLFVELLFVPANLRGRNFGSELLATAERIARKKMCVGIWLDTFSFQAPLFYEKHGYVRFAVLENYPIGKERIFLHKLL